MNDMSGLVYNNAQDIAAQAAATDKWVTAQARKERRAKNGWRAYGLMMTALVFLEGSALNYAVPLIRVVPVFYYAGPDGITRTAITTDSLPFELSDANIKQSLFLYLEHRESYSLAEVDYNHYVVESMSSRPVLEGYNAAMDGKNPNSYMAKYGDKRVVHIYLEAIKEYKPATSTAAGSVTFGFVRTVMDAGMKQPKSETWTATMTFIQDYKSALNIRDIQSFNPNRIVITDYPGAQPPMSAVIQRAP